MLSILNFPATLRRLDAYPKTLDDFQIKTPGGAIITIISHVTMVLLFYSELCNYLTPNLKEELFVDTSRSSKLKINFDFIINTISCDWLSLDAMDATGEQHLQMSHNIYKRRLDLEGNPIQDPKRTGIYIVGAKKNIQKSPKAAVLECGSCYGAESKEFGISCCNTCEEIREAYRIKKWAITNLTLFEQCKNDKSVEEITHAFSEGCQIYGYIEVNRVGGSFHIAPGESFSVNHLHIHNVQLYTSSQFNFTHKIRHLSFGTNVPGKTNPLDGIQAIATKNSTMFNYYIKIVPTIFIRLDGSILKTNQFSTTSHSRQISFKLGHSGMPGIFFSYELSPLMVKYTQSKKSLGHFLTNTCAIIGGTYTVAGIIDNLLYKTVRAIQRKIELGKYS